METADVVLGLGSNLGDRERALKEGLRLLAARGFHELLRSSTYSTEPVGGPPQGWFLNMVVAGTSELTAQALLAACQSATRSMADAFLGLGPKLVGAGVPAVVAMQDVVTVETARKFSATFYRQLLAHDQVDLAVNEARSTLLTAGRVDAAVPVLFMRMRDGLLFAPTDEETSSDTSGVNVSIGDVHQQDGSVFSVNVAGRDVENGSGE
jgi:hypothetical protein